MREKRMNDNYPPPGCARRILKLLLRHDLVEQRLGDYEEVFRCLVENEGLFFAKKWYWQEVIKSLPLLLLNQIYWRGEMFRNYFKIAYRNISKSKVYSFINIAGLSLGLASAFLILLWVNDEMSYDKFHEKASDIYHVYLEVTNDQGEVGSQPTASFEVTKLMKEKYPEVIDAVRLLPIGERVLKCEDKMFVENNGFTAEPEVFKIFTFPFIRGNSSTALSDPNSIVLTESMAYKYFGTSDPIGKIIRFNGAFDMKVTGVIRDVPDNSYLQFDYLIPDDFKKNIGYDLQYSGNYFFACSFLTFLYTQNDFNVDEFNKKFAEEVNFQATSVKGSYKIVPLLETNSYSKYNGQGVYYIFIAIALLIIVLAAINFVNLTTARSTVRLKEIGVRKVAGALKSQLVAQMLSESIFLSVFSFLMAMILVFLVLPTLNEITQKHINLSFGKSELILVFLLIALISGFLSGLYPAYVISSFNPVQIMKNKLTVKGRTVNVRQVLVVLQYTFTAVFFICSAIITSQFYYMSNSDVGFVKDDVYYFRLDETSSKKANVIENELLQDPQIIGMSTSQHLPVLISGGYFQEWGLKDGVASYLCPTKVDYDYLATLNLELSEGRFYSRDYLSDKQNAVVLNEEAAKRLGDGPYEGKQFYFENNFYTVIGVVKNFNHTSLQNKIQPLAFFLDEDSPRYAFVKLRNSGLPEGNTALALKNINSVLEKYSSEFPAEVLYLKSFKYQEETVLDDSRKLISYATLLALVISSLGLLGLSAYVAERRKKEIGIRKVLGSSMWDVVVKLSLSFLGLILLSNLIAIPIGYLIMRDFLTAYAFRIELSLSYFLVPAAFILTISLLTVAYHSVRAANANPVDIIKYE